MLFEQHRDLGDETDEKKDTRDPRADMFESIVFENKLTDEDREQLRRLRISTK